MIVCLCHSVSDRTIRREIDAGCNTLRKLREKTGAGTDCGQCACELKALLRERAEAATPTQPLTPVFAK